MIYMIVVDLRTKLTLEDNYYLYMGLFFQDLQAMPNGRKRPIFEVDDVLMNTRGTDMVANYMTTSNKWKKTKRNKATASEQQWQHELIGTSTHIQEHTASENQHKFDSKVYVIL
jgi:hypothetical protein